MKYLLSPWHLIRWFWPRTPQEAWNILLVIFTGVLALFTYQLSHSDAAFLDLNIEGIHVDDDGFLYLPIENDGRRPTGNDVLIETLQAVKATDDSTLECHTVKFLLPAIPPGKAPWIVRDVVFYWGLHKEAVKTGKQTVFSMGEVVYWNGVNLFFNKTHYPWCVHTISLKHDTEIGAAACSEHEIFLLRQLTPAVCKALIQHPPVGGGVLGEGQKDRKAGIRPQISLNGHREN
jgi:hypothetical protein